MRSTHDYTDLVKDWLTEANGRINQSLTRSILKIIWKNDKTIVAYFVEYTVEKFEKFLII
jgi:hypothetical protein